MGDSVSFPGVIYKHSHVHTALLHLPMLSFLVLKPTELMDVKSISAPIPAPPLCPSADNLVEDAALPALPTLGSTIPAREGEAR
jgi:hypothetical protein